MLRDLRRGVLAALLVVGGCGGSTASTAVVTHPPGGTDLPAAPSPTTAVRPAPTATDAVLRRFDLGQFAFGPDGSVVATDCAHEAVLRLDSATHGTLLVSDPGFTGAADFGDGGPASAAKLLCPAGLVFDPQGRLLIADHGHNRVRRIEGDGTITTIVGRLSTPLPNLGSFTGDGGPAVDATINAPVGLTVDPAGNLYIADRENDRIRRIGRDGIIETFAGNGSDTFSGDGGPATRASLDFPLFTAVATNGDVYIADDNHNRVRVVTPDGVIRTVIGDGTFGSAGDGGPATKAQVNDPHGIALDAAGNLYVADYGSNRIRRIDPKGIVTTIAGTGGDRIEAIGRPALGSDVPQPGMLAIGPDAALYIQDEMNFRILRLDLETGILTVFAGGPGGVAAE